ncbi:MAG TPA: rod shape-determining protein MreD [Gaiellaceae bacterium]|nr:rod shape-determining protein MreD [Gaiellaceae bacterium]
MSEALDALKLAALVLVAAVIQVTLLAGWTVGGGAADLLLVTVVAVALLRGSLAGATVGFFGGLVADTATLQTLGLTSLLLTVAGYWAGRYGETTGRDRLHAPLVSVAVVTVLYTVGALVLHFVLGDEVSVGRVLGSSLVATVGFNALLTVPVFALCRRLLGPPPRLDRAREVQLLA